MEKKYSPEQIAGRLRVEFPDDPEMWVSTETIYQSLYVQSRGALRRALTRCLRTGRALRHPARHPGQRKNRIPDMVNISERPAEAADRAVPEVRGARQNNLREVSLDIPKRRITVFTGVSGSGTSSLVFGTIAAESQRPAGLPDRRKRIGLRARRPQNPYGFPYLAVWLMSCLRARRVTRCTRSPSASTPGTVSRCTSARIGALKG